MDQPQLNWISNYIWGIADDVLRDLYVRGKYRDVILPMTVLRRLDSLLEPTKPAVLEMKATLDKAGIVNQDQALRQAAGQAFYNTSKFTLRDLRNRASQAQLKADFEAYLDGFSSNVQDILEKFEFRNQIPRLSKADALGTLIEKLVSADVNLSPNPVFNGDGIGQAPGPRQPRHGHDLRGAGPALQRGEQRGGGRALDATRRREAHGEPDLPAHRRPDRVGHLPALRRGVRHRRHADRGRGDPRAALAEARGKEVATHLYGQEINSETYAIAKADLLLKGEGEAADNIVGGPEYSTLSNDAFPSREFDFMLSNPPYGKSWKSDLERMGGKDGIKDPRFLIEHGGDAEYSLLTRSSDGQMLFLANMLSKMKHGHAARQPDRRGPQRQLAVHRRCRPGREQHPPLDHRERLARGHRRPAAQHVLQHRHRHLHLGADQPQARAPARQGAAHRRDEVVQAAPQEPRAARTASCRTTTSSGSATPSSPSRRPSSRRSSRTPPSATGRSPSSDRCGSKGIDPNRAYSPKEIKALKETGESGRGRSAGHQEDPQAGRGQSRSAARPVRGDHRRQDVRRSSTSPTATSATPSRCPCSRRAASRRSSAARCCPTPPDAWYDPDERQDRLRDQLHPVLLQAAAAPHA